MNTNPCSDTMAASWPNTLPSSLIVFSMTSIASPRIFIYVFVGWASSIINNCWSEEGPTLAEEEAAGSRLRMSELEF